MEMTGTVPVLLTRNGSLLSGFLWPAKTHQHGIVQAYSAVQKTQRPENNTENILSFLSHSVPARTS